MGETLLFCLVFLSQILLISWVYPGRVINRARYVLEKFPPSTHPKGYPLPIEAYERWLRSIARANLVIVVAGLLVIGLILATLIGEWDGWILSSSRKSDWDEFIVVPFFLAQIVVASGYMSFSGAKFIRAMAKAPPPRMRTTELRRRRLVDFVSPTALIAVALTNVAFIAFVLYYYWRFDYPVFKTVATIASDALMLLALSFTVVVALLAPKADPYQAHQDRHSVLKVVVQQALALLIAYPVLMTAVLISKLIDPRLLYAIVASLFSQGIAVAMLWPSYSYRVDKIDFDVYRRDARDSTPDETARISSP